MPGRTLNGFAVGNLSPVGLPPGGPGLWRGWPILAQVALMPIKIAIMAADRGGNDRTAINGCAEAAKAKGLKRERLGLTA